MMRCLTYWFLLCSERHLTTRRRTQQVISLSPLVHINFACHSLRFTGMSQCSAKRRIHAIAVRLSTCILTNDLSLSSLKSCKDMEQGNHGGLDEKQL
eukprot:scaffold36914_cov21-Prasinocladus_malaysianus.AAC.1